jgi:hypothetical protein
MFMDSSTPLVIKVWDSNPGRMIERQICLLTTKKNKKNSVFSMQEKEEWKECNEIVNVYIKL